MTEHTLWVEKYRPKKLDDIILPPNLKKTFKSVISKGDVPNMILAGTAGLGKTTVAKAICHELDLDYIVINGSKDGVIETLRKEIKQFASSVSFSGGKKVIILDEADYLSHNFQPALRGFIEEFSDNCRFILTCNFKNRIIEPLHSRCSVYEFNTTRKEMANLSAQFLSRLEYILKEENVEYDKKTIANLIIKYSPDWRRILNEIQRFSLSGKVTSETVYDTPDKFSDLIKFLREKNFKNMRKWVVNNIDIDTSAIFRGLYDEINKSIKKSSIPQMVLILADYQYKASFVADQEINTVACLTEIMMNVEFEND